MRTEHAVLLLSNDVLAGTTITNLQELRASIIEYHVCQSSTVVKSPNSLGACRRDALERRIKKDARCWWCCRVDEFEPRTSLKSARPREAFTCPASQPLTLRLLWIQPDLHLKPTPYWLTFASDLKVTRLVHDA